MCYQKEAIYCMYSIEVVCDFFSIIKKEFSAFRHVPYLASVCCSILMNVTTSSIILSWQHAKWFYHIFVQNIYNTFLQTMPLLMSDMHPLVNFSSMHLHYSLDMFPMLYHVSELINCFLIQIKIWEDRKSVPLFSLKPHDGNPVYSATFLTAPDRPDHVILITGVLDSENRIT